MRTEIILIPRRSTVSDQIVKQHVHTGRRLVLTKELIISNESLIHSTKLLKVRVVDNFKKQDLTGQLFLRNPPMKSGKDFINIYHLSIFFQFYYFTFICKQ